MIIKQDIRKRILLIVLFVVILSMILLLGYFNRNKSYGCTIQFIDTDTDTVLMSFEATCKDDGQETDRDPYYTRRVYSFEVYSNEKEQQYDTTYNTNHWYTGWDAQD